MSYKEWFLSPSALSVFRNCPRCFWHERVKNIKRPRGIFPSLPGGVDRVVKTAMDQLRGNGEPPPLNYDIAPQGLSFFLDQKQLDQWRNWRSGLKCQIETADVVLSGALDDLLLHEGKYVPFDYKTKGTPTKQEDAEKYYQPQLDCYGLLLQKKGLEVANFGILLYFSPCQGSGDGPLWAQQTILMSVDPRRAEALVSAAAACLNGEKPKSSVTCEYCKWLADMEGAK